ncbi:hypothetical protein ACH5RR_026019 [Cinchona calisaya]|uniref:Uncharacterized protein n=1 Tax=Cinchona calisaya TaxID=153742 RepID=A0ABD2Z5B9_9GENT
MFLVGSINSTSRSFLQSSFPIIHLGKTASQSRRSRNNISDRRFVFLEKASIANSCHLATSTTAYNVSGLCIWTIALISSWKPFKKLEIKWDSNSPGFLIIIVDISPSNFS